MELISEWKQKSENSSNTLLKFEKRAWPDFNARLVHLKIKYPYTFPCDKAKLSRKYFYSKFFPFTEKIKLISVDWNSFVCISHARWVSLSPSREMKEKLSTKAWLSHCYTTEPNTFNFVYVRKIYYSLFQILEIVRRASSSSPDDCTCIYILLFSKPINN